MEYELALTKAWLELGGLKPEKKQTIRLLGDEYEIDLNDKKVSSLSCNVTAKAYVSIFILHYLVQKLRGLPAVTGEWISFKELDGNIGYYPTFKKRVIDHILKKYGPSPERLLDLIERFPAKSIQMQDASVVLDVFDRVPLLITMERGDEEFGPEANVLFDKSIKDIFCTEDVVVLAEFVASII